MTDKTLLWLAISSCAVVVLGIAAVAVVAYRTRPQERRERPEAGRKRAKR